MAGIRIKQMCIHDYVVGVAVDIPTHSPLTNDGLPLCFYRLACLAINNNVQKLMSGFQSSHRAEKCRVPELHCTVFIEGILSSSLSHGVVYTLNYLLCGHLLSIIHALESW